MTFNEDFYYHPRKYNTIELWKDVTPEQWNDAGWQRKNSIRSVDQLKKVIRLTDYQESEIMAGKAPQTNRPGHACLCHKRRLYR